MARPSKLAERNLIALVRSGEWEIDSQGRIWRTAIRSGNRWTGETVVRPCRRRRADRPCGGGHLQVAATIDGSRLYCMAQRLVWQHFRGNIPPRHEIHHRNEKHADNRLRNLVCSAEHPITPRYQWGDANFSATLTNRQVAAIRKAYRKGMRPTMADLAKKYGVKHQHISRIVRGERRPKQSGPVRKVDHRHSASDRDAFTGQFIKTRPRALTSRAPELTK